MTAIAIKAGNSKADNSEAADCSKKVKTDDAGGSKPYPPASFTVINVPRYLLAQAKNSFIPFACDIPSQEIIEGSDGREKKLCPVHNRECFFDMPVDLQVQCLLSSKWHFFTLLNLLILFISFLGTVIAAVFRLGAFEIHPFMIQEEPDMDHPGYLTSTVNFLSTAVMLPTGAIFVMQMLLYIAHLRQDVMEVWKIYTRCVIAQVVMVQLFMLVICNYIRLNLDEFRSDALKRTAVGWAGVTLLCLAIFLCLQAFLCIRLSRQICRFQTFFNIFVDKERQSWTWRFMLCTILPNWLFIVLSVFTMHIIQNSDLQFGAPLLKCTESSTDCPRLRVPSVDYYYPCIAVLANMVYGIISPSRYLKVKQIYNINTFFRFCLVLVTLLATTMSAVDCHFVYKLDVSFTRVYGPLYNFALFSAMVAIWERVLYRRTGDSMKLAKSTNDQTPLVDNDHVPAATPQEVVVDPKDVEKDTVNLATSFPAFVKEHKKCSCIAFVWGPEAYKKAFPLTAKKRFFAEGSDTFLWFCYMISVFNFMVFLPKDFPSVCLSNLELAGYILGGYFFLRCIVNISNRVNSDVPYTLTMFRIYLLCFENFVVSALVLAVFIYYSVCRSHPFVQGVTVPCVLWNIYYLFLLFAAHKHRAEVKRAGGV